MSDAYIERRIEAPGGFLDYPSRKFTDDEVRRGDHRAVRGGQWDTQGRLLVDFLSSVGLRPDHRLLDVGCGEFHAGSHLVDFLDPGHYYGIEANPSLVSAGYDVELTDEQRTRLPLANLRVTDRFDADFGVRFDFAIAQSIFTHLSLNHLRLCLFRVAKSMKPGGRLYVSFHEQNASRDVDLIVRRNRQAPYFGEREIYWYYRDDLRWAAGFSPWEYRYIGGWGHHNEQRIVEFTRRFDTHPDVVSLQDAPPTPPIGNQPRAESLAARGRRWVVGKF